MPFICCCEERLVDPQTKIIIAAHGWMQEKKEYPKKFWVRIDPHPVEYFAREDAAKFFYDQSIVNLRIEMNGANGTNATGSKRSPSTNGHK